MLHKLLNALYPVTSLARLCGLLPIEIHASQCHNVQKHVTRQNNNRIKTFDIQNDNDNDHNHTASASVDDQHQSILWHILGPIWLILIIGTYLTQLFYYQTLKSNSTTRIFELFHEHASVLYIIFCLIIIQFKRSAIFGSRVVMHEIESKLINDMKCEQMYYELIHKYSFIGLFIFIAVVFYEIIIRSYLCFWNPTNPNEPPPIILGSSTDSNSNDDSNTPETELLTRLIMVLLNVLTTSIGLALQINFFMFMMVLRLRFKTVNYEINKIAKITEHDDDDNDDDDDDDSDNTTDNDDTDNTDKSSDNEHENNINKDNNNTIRHTEFNDSNHHYVQGVTTTNPSKINNLRMLTTIRHGIYTGSGGLDDNSFYTSNVKWSSPDEYDESNKFYIRIRILADIHDKLSLALSIVNSIYSVQLLFAIGIQFVLITATLYEEYETIDDHVNNYKVFFINLIFNLIRCAQTLMLIWICSNTCYHANRASIFIHKIVYMEESKLKREIENFSMQLLHNKVQVTAGGFFPIDFTLLYTIVGAVTTYLVILVQFHLADKEIKKKHQGAITGTTAK